ncbi:MAG: DsrE family protein [Halioglobus sp.]
MSVSALHAQAETASADQLYVVDIELQTADEFYDLLSRAEQLLVEGASLATNEAKVSFVLHGPVLKNLSREDYLANKKLVDLAASLSAMDVIEVKACRAWMRHNGMEEAQLLPFVETVPYGPGAVKAMLQSENYTRF